MEKLKKSMGKIVVCLCEIAVGVVLLVNPDSFTKMVITGVGILLCILGAIAVINYFRADPAEAALSQELTRGVLALMLGVFCIYKSGWIVNTFLPIVVLYGVAALVIGVLKLQWTVDMIRLKADGWIPTAVAAALSIILGLVIIFSPKSSMWTFIAIALIVTGAVDAVSVFAGVRSGPGAAD